MKEPPRAAVCGLQLLGLCSFAIAQPLFDLLTRHPSLLVARRASSAEILALGGVLALGPPLLLWGIELLVGLASRRLAFALHHVFVFALVGAVSLPLLKRIGFAAPTTLLSVAAIVALGFVWHYGRRQGMHSFVSASGLAAVAFVLLFFDDPSIARLVRHEGEVDLESVEVGAPTPIVMLILDELPLSSLLDASGSIDAVRYPSFARLASTSTWFRNAASVDERTLQAIPAILTGRFPGETNKLAVAFEHPRNLFSILDGPYRLNVVENYTHLFERRSTPRATPWDRLRALHEDLALIYLHIVLPESWTLRLPSVTQTWKDFAVPLAGDFKGQQRFHNRPRNFRRFSQSIAPHPRSTLHFLHVTLPHSPWHYLPSGTSYTPFRDDGAFEGRWLGDPWWGIAAYQRHLLQLQFTDALLGELLDRLEDMGLFDESIVIVAADHGATFWPDEQHRDLRGASHPEDILRVPLFVKRPRQHAPEVSDRVVQTIDILPTLLDLIDVEVPWSLDGCSAISPDCPEREEVVAFVPARGSTKRSDRVRFPRSIFERRETLDRKSAWFGSGGDAARSLYRFGPHANLVGRRLSTLEVGTAFEGEIDTEDPRLTRDSGATRPPVPTRISAPLRLDESYWASESSTPWIAIATAGVVRTVVPAPLDGWSTLRGERYVPPEFSGRRVAAMLPPLAIEGHGPTRLFLIRGTPERPELYPLRARSERR